MASFCAQFTRRLSCFRKAAGCARAQCYDTADAGICRPPEGPPIDEARLVKSRPRNKAGRSAGLASRYPVMRAFTSSAHLRVSTTKLAEKLRAVVWRAAALLVVVILLALYAAGADQSGLLLFVSSARATNCLPGRSFGRPSKADHSYLHAMRSNWICCCCCCTQHIQP